jgi:hypothetical protein
VSDERAPWDRRDGETSAAHAAFRAFRDLGPTRTMPKLRDAHPELSTQTRLWSARWDWVARASAWDDAQHMLEDAERLEALRDMHRNHRTAARALQRVALQALGQIDISAISAAEVARLFDLGSRLERLTLTTSVAELQGKSAALDDDPFEIIARELSGA